MLFRSNGACFPANSQAARLTKSAVNCTKVAVVQILVCFVTPVLKTPWMLIIAPDNIAIIIPIIAKTCLPFLLSIFGKQAFYSFFKHGHIAHCQKIPIHKKTDIIPRVLHPINSALIMLVSRARVGGQKTADRSRRFLF